MMNCIFSIFTVFSLAVVFLPRAGCAELIIGSDTTYWSPITYCGGTVPDPALDQQTGGQEGDLVGDASHPAFYTQFDDAGTSDLTDGTLGFRIRLNQAKNDAKMTFNQILFVGMDANLDGVLDLFVGVLNSPSGSGNLAVWLPGTGANDGPSTTSIVSPPQVVFEEEINGNYHFGLVDLVSDPDATSFALGGGANVFLSFSFDFHAIVTNLSNVGVSIDENSGINYVMATATQDNALNIDINGINGGTGSTLTYGELGAASDTFAPTGDAIPEPAVMALLSLGSFSLLAWRRLVSR